MSGSRAQESQSAVPAAVPTAISASCGDLFRPPRHKYCHEKRCQLLIAGDLRSIPWAIQMHPNPQLTIPAPSFGEGHGAQEVCAGYDRAPTGYNEEHRGAVLGSEATSLAPCHTIYSPPRPIALSHRIMYIPCRAVIAPWLLHYLTCPKRAQQFSLCFLL